MNGGDGGGAPAFVYWMSPGLFVRKPATAVPPKTLSGWQFTMSCVPVNSEQSHVAQQNELGPLMSILPSVMSETRNAPVGPSPAFLMCMYSGHLK